MSRGAPAEAAEAFREARAIALATSGAHHVDAIDAGREFARALMALDELGEAEAVLRETLAAITGQPDAIEGARAGAASSKALFCWSLYAETLLRLDAPDEAEALLAGAVESARAMAGEGSPYEWLRWALESQLGGAMLVRAASLPARARQGALLEAAAWIEAAGERMLALAQAGGPQIQREMTAAALERAVRVHAALHELEPSEAAAARLAEWRERAAALE